MITQEQVKELFNYNPETGIISWKKSPRRGISKFKAVGCVSNCGYLQVTVNSKQHLTHRIIFMFVNGYLPKTIDHIDGNKLNNRIENLRSCTQNENCYNTITRKDNTSGFKGICWNEQAKNWKVRVYKNKKCHNIGHFKMLNDAVEACKVAREKLHKEFANHG